MTADQRAAYDAWHRARRPGLTRAARKAERARTRQNAEARHLIAQRAPQQTIEAVRLGKALAAAKAELARLEDRITDSDSDNGGVFA